MAPGQDAAGREHGEHQEVRREPAQPGEYRAPASLRMSGGYDHMGLLGCKHRATASLRMSGGHTIV